MDHADYRDAVDTGRLPMAAAQRSSGAGEGGAENQEADARPADPAVGASALHQRGSFDHVLTPEEGAEVFALALLSNLAQTVISTVDLQPRLDSVLRIASAARGPAAAVYRPKRGRSSVRRPYLAPRGELETKLAGIWATFFGAEQVGVEDNVFDDLGADSLMAIHLIGLMNTELKLSLSSHSLLEAPTIAAMASGMGSRASLAKGAGGSSHSAQPTPLIELRRGSSRRALFLIHPIGGHVYIYRDLVMHLAEEQSVYALQAPGLDGQAEPLTSVAEMAAHYLAAIRACQPEGPYWLGGASFGGVVAYEIMQRLQADGQEVTFIAMIDTAGPGDLQRAITSDEEIVAYLLQLGALHPVLTEELSGLPPKEQVRRFVQHTGERAQIMPALPPEHLSRSLDQWRIGTRAMLEYTPVPTRCPIVFFRAIERDTVNPCQPDRSWRPLASGGFDLHEVPGNHITMNGAPHVQIIADVLTTYMERSNAR